MDSKKNIEDYLKDPYINGIIYTVSSRFANAIDSHDISSIAMWTLNTCIDRYDPTKGAKFTSYFYQQLTYAYKNELKKKKPEFSCSTLENTHSAIKRKCLQEEQNKRSENEKHIFHILESIPEKMKKIIEQKFFYRMSFKEIAEENGYSRETARRRFQKAIKLCRKLVKT